MESSDKLAMQRWKEFSTDIEAMLQSAPIALGEANPPNSIGVYALYDEHMTLVYVGITKNLCDRLLNKHTSGDDNHAIQRAYRDLYPDRTSRREFIKKHVKVKWLAVEDLH